MFSSFLNFYSFFAPQSFCSQNPANCFNSDVFGVSNSYSPPSLNDYVYGDSYLLNDQLSSTVENWASSINCSLYDPDDILKSPSFENLYKTAATFRSFLKNLCNISTINNQPVNVLASLRVDQKDIVSSFIIKYLGGFKAYSTSKYAKQMSPIVFEADCRTDTSGSSTCSGQFQIGVSKGEFGVREENSSADKAWGGSLHVSQYEEILCSDPSVLVKMDERCKKGTKKWEADHQNLSADERWKRLNLDRVLDYSDCPKTCLKSIPRQYLYYSALSPKAEAGNQLVLKEVIASLKTFDHPVAKHTPQHIATMLAILEKAKTGLVK